MKIFLSLLVILSVLLFQGCTVHREFPAPVATPSDIAQDIEARMFGL